VEEAFDPGSRDGRGAARGTASGAGAPSCWPADGGGRAALLDDLTTDEIASTIADGQW
jgi:hypothetical protein